jgi:methionine-S-sulfoxide reductase
VEFALCRLPGVISTQTGYAGGTTKSPTYESVCSTETGHAEVVRVIFDPFCLKPKILVDCFLALHDPTKVRAMGNHAEGTGQYRSCIFVTTPEIEITAREALSDCQRQLDKELSTQVGRMDANVDNWFWKAEERHHRHDEKGGDNPTLSTLTTTEWLDLYGKRKEAIWGSAQTVSALTSL